ncbi:MAG: hypothetical protein HY258_07450 [Chloroflexi bacterium]|nr:hypothetical protein [Chloroflexota bacterium]
MYTLAPDEKISTVMVYSRNKLIHGDIVTKNNVRVSIWLRTQGVPNYVHLLKPQVLLFGGSPAKSLTYNELFFPAERIIGFHLAPPASDPLDYDPDEANRIMLDVNLILGVFMLKGKVRVSTHADLATSIEVAHVGWLSVYDAEISNPFVPQMPAIKVPMLLVRPAQVSFGL